MKIEKLTVLRIVVNYWLTASDHVTMIIKSSCRNMYALKSRASNTFFSTYICILRIRMLSLCVQGYKKRALLGEMLPLIGTNLRLQRVYAEYHQQLELLNSPASWFLLYQTCYLTVSSNEPPGAYSIVWVLSIRSAMKCETSVFILSRRMHEWSGTWTVAC